MCEVKLSERREVREGYDVTGEAWKLNVISAFEQIACLRA